MILPPLVPETQEEKRRWSEGEERHRERLQKVGKPH
jgi:hypothetical protein